MGNTAVRADIELQEEEFRGITEEDRESPCSLGGKTNHVRMVCLEDAYLTIY